MTTDFSQQPRRATLILASFVLAAFFPADLGVAQEAKPTPTPEGPKARLTEVKRLPDGSFLFAVRLVASNTKPLLLFRPPPPQPDGQPPGDQDSIPRPVTLADSTLTDLYTKKVYQALPVVPKAPYFGPIDITGTLAPGGWTQLGVAFPAIAQPPLDEKGQKQPYRLLLSIPELKIESLIMLDPETFQPISKNVAPER